MYTNIQIEPALHEISEYLRAQHGVQFHDYNPDALISALEIVFRNTTTLLWATPIGSRSLAQGWACHQHLHGPLYSLLSLRIGKSQTTQHG
jgi:hypothetical protein